MRRRKIDPAQLDLFDWAAQRPTAKVLSMIPRLAKRMWAERGLPPVYRGGKVVGFERRRA